MHHAPVISDYRGGGYLIVRIAERAAWMAADVLPEHLFSASACICPRVPGIWAVRWVSMPNEERFGSAEAFGIGRERLAGIVDWVTAGLQSGKLGWPGMFLSLSTARAFAHEWLESTDGLALLGIGMQAQFVATFLREGAPGGAAARAWGQDVASPGTPAVYAAVRKGRSPARGGQALGFELLGYDGMEGFHSWLCNGLDRSVYAQLGIRPNEVGLLNTADEARRALQSISTAGVGKEPGVWLPWLIIRYAIA
jgi:hypothetical protein